MNYDVIIIGAGLVSALKLCKNGKKVAIFEKHYIPGGYATNFSRKGKNGNLYNFDVSLHSLSGANKGATVYNILDNLGIIPEIELIKKEEPSLLIRNNKVVYIPNDKDKYKETLKQNYPDFKNNIDELFKFMDDFYQNLIGLSLETTIPKYEEELSNQTLSEFIRKFVNNDEFIEDFSYLWVYAGLPPSKLSAYYAMCMISSYIFGGENYIKGGGGHLSKVLKENIEKYNGDVFLSSEIIEIKSNGNLVTSVTTKKGDTFTARNFIFAGDPINTFSMIKNNSAAEQYLETLNKRQQSSAITQLYVAIDCPTEEIGIKNSHTFIYNHTSDAIHDNFKNGNLDNLSFIITAYDKLDKNLNNFGSYLNMAMLDYAHNWPEHNTDEYKSKKQEIINLFLAKLTDLYPKIKEHIQVIELGTPRTTNRYTNNTSGCIYGWAQTTNQSGINRQYLKTPFSNVIILVLGHNQVVDMRELLLVDF